MKLNRIEIIDNQNPASNDKTNTHKRSGKKKELVHQYSRIKTFRQADHYNHLLLAVIAKAIAVRPPRPKDIMSASCPVIVWRMVVNSAGVMSITQ
jgi:hypothetical protein